ncbi:uncharacterized protein LOC113216371 [Frankliniella occidentalis]|uniref:Uncharacterized protein LOC113216371 n=1 Tax=Frankliniella occidentalis TaxID=133901 RepID=A0A9C6X543_FRAOC|nr:uncharacterized protein LOC113216371 [Frankliniella occidentalis]
MFGPQNVSTRSKVMFLRVQQQNIIPNSLNGTGESADEGRSDDEEQARDSSKNEKNVTDGRKDEKDGKNVTGMRKDKDIAKETKKIRKTVTGKRKENSVKERKKDNGKVIEERRDMEKTSKESKLSEKNLKEVKDQQGEKTVKNANPIKGVKEVTEIEHDALSFTGSEVNVLSPNFVKEVRDSVSLSVDKKVRSWLETFEGPSPSQATVLDKENILSSPKKLKKDVCDNRHGMKSLKSGRHKSRGSKPRNILHQSLNISPQQKSAVGLNTKSSTAIPPTIESEADRCSSDTTNNKLSVPSANTTELSSQQDVSTKERVQTDSKPVTSIVTARKRLGNTSLLLPSKQQPVLRRTRNKVFSSELANVSRSDPKTQGIKSLKTN